MTINWNDEIFEAYIHRVKKNCSKQGLRVRVLFSFLYSHQTIMKVIRGSIQQIE
jgi:hypothetical protein